MEAALSIDERRTLSREDLFAPFREAFKPAANWRVGTEFEKFGIKKESNAPVEYDGDRGVSAILQALTETHGWRPVREHEAGEVIALLRDQASITLEPGAQLELSGAPFRSLHDTLTEIQGHLEELRAVSEPLGLRWLGTGFHPLAAQSDLPWVPKLRYGVMREYLPTRGGMGLDMMRRTCTVQANFDYADEKDAMRKLRVSLALSPIATAMFANSPFVEGAATGERTRRARVWTDTDPDRTGLLPFAWREGANLSDYVEWALDAPMFLVKRGGTIVHNTGQSFRSFMRDGFQGTEANAEDWLSHLATLFPEVRLKKTLEVRGTDAQQTPGLVVAIPALWKGLLYDETSLAAAERLTAKLDHTAADQARLAAADAGLAGRLAGTPLSTWAEQVLDIARAGLERIDERDSAGESEAKLLDPIAELVERGETPADGLLRRAGDSPSAQDLVDATAL